MANRPAEPFFAIDDGWFVGNGPARGPWTADACHAGPVSAALARAAEHTVPDKQLVRLTVNFVRPIPMSGFRITTDVVRDGRVAAAVTLTLQDREGRVCALGTSTHIVEKDVGQLPSHELEPPVRDGSVPGIFVLTEAPHGEPFFSQYVDLEYPPGEDPGFGATTVWMTTPPLLAAEAMSPFQSICPLSDCGNTTSRHFDFHELSFVNPDITIALHRLPATDWLASSAVSYWQNNGIGLSQAVLFDEVGPVGVALQSLILRALTH